jgi:hypothetical protein
MAARASALSAAVSAATTAAFSVLGMFQSMAPTAKSTFRNREEYIQEYGLSPDELIAKDYCDRSSCKLPVQ